MLADSDSDSDELELPSDTEAVGFFCFDFVDSTLDFSGFGRGAMEGLRELPDDSSSEISLSETVSLLNLGFIAPSPNRRARPIGN